MLNQVVGAQMAVMNAEFQVCQVKLDPWSGLGSNSIIRFSADHIVQSLIIFAGAGGLLSMQSRQATVKFLPSRRRNAHVNALFESPNTNVSNGLRVFLENYNGLLSIIIFLTYVASIRLFMCTVCQWHVLVSFEFSRERGVTTTGGQLENIQIEIHQKVATLMRVNGKNDVWRDDGFTCAHSGSSSIAQ